MVNTWDGQSGNASFSIAVIDSGCDLTHPDLAFTPNTASNPTHFDADEAAAGDPTPYNANPDTNVADINNAHGTLVAGLAGARLDNNAGIAGVAGGYRIMPLKVFPSPQSSYLAAAINWARTNNAAHASEWDRHQ